MLHRVNRGRSAALLETHASLVVTSTLILAFASRCRASAITVWKPTKMVVALLVTHATLTDSSTLIPTGVGRGRPVAPLGHWAATNKLTIPGAAASKLTIPRAAEGKLTFPVT